MSCNCSNMSIYLISGDLRRQKKKKLNQLKSYVKNFWQCEDIHRIYGGGLDDITCKKLISEAEDQIKELELQLSKPSLSIQRDIKMNYILDKD